MICERCGIGHMHHRYSYYDAHLKAQVNVYICDHCGANVRYQGTRRLD